MAAKPETRYRLRVEKRLPPGVYHLKLSLPYQGGVADSWYSHGRDLWVEYKWLEKLPVRVPLDITKGEDPMLSKLQQDWLKDRHAEGRDVAVILGTPKGGIVFPGVQWLDPIPAKDIEDRLMTVDEVAEWLQQELALV